MVIYTNLLSPPECHGTLRGVKWSCIAEGPSEGSPVPVVQGASDSFARCQEWGRITGTLRLLEEQRYKQAQSHKDVYTVNRLNHPNIPKYQLLTKRNHNLETTAFKNEEKHLCLKCSQSWQTHTGIKGNLFDFTIWNAFISAVHWITEMADWRSF